ncbi:hypothetical protein SAMN06297144_0315 [Sphingomonas guangdongensis]|uniref:Uncharacterized protein n=1 Tax=Sphingomonas guangdongensis TaxID=1141890 RepID=A0A285QAX4_9SPHN|nr:hypothetical protein [Sphingomonas guangdongensis]SOB78986.1 hypothetical protein SAMN06297144_0315 [Sphingomonas guangdongensis]
MRTLALALPALLLASPAVAQDAAPDVARVADRLQDPVMQEGVAAAISALAGIVLDTKVGAFAHAVDPETEVARNATLRDLKRRSDPDFERRLRENTRSSVKRAGNAAGDVAMGAQELGRTAGRLARALAPLASLYAPRD